MQNLLSILLKIFILINKLEDFYRLSDIGPTIHIILQEPACMPSHLCIVLNLGASKHANVNQHPNDVLPTVKAR